MLLSVEHGSWKGKKVWLAVCTPVHLLPFKCYLPKYTSDNNHPPLVPVFISLSYSQLYLIFLVSLSFFFGQGGGFHICMGSDQKLVISTTHREHLNFGHGTATGNCQIGAAAAECGSPKDLHVLCCKAVLC